MSASPKSRSIAVIRFNASSKPSRPNTCFSMLSSDTELEKGQQDFIDRPFANERMWLIGDVSVLRHLVHHGLDQSMFVAVVNIRKMRMSVRHGQVSFIFSHSLHSISVRKQARQNPVLPSNMHTSMQGNLALICHVACRCVWTSTVICESPLNRCSTAW